MQEKKRKYLHQTINEGVVLARKIVRNFIGTDEVKSSKWTFGTGAPTSLIVVGTRWANQTLLVGLESSLVGVFADGTCTSAGRDRRLAADFRKHSLRTSDTFGIRISDIQVRAC